jgi:hypothetical protein
VTCTQPGCGGTIRDGCRGLRGLAAADHDGAASLLADLSPPSAGDRLAPEEDRRIELVDMANAIRPRTLT